MQKNGNVLVASFVVAGLSMGASFVGVPIITGIAGFFPAIFMTLLNWLFTLALALLTAEATLANPDGANIITITRNLIGKTWMIICGILFFSIYFLPTVGYPIVGYYILSAPQVLRLSEYFFNVSLSPYLLALIIGIILGLVLGSGIRITARVNFVLMISFLGVLIFAFIKGSEFVAKENLLYTNWLYSFFAFPVLFNAMSYITVIPSLCTYVNRDVKKIKQMIVLGSIISLAGYIIWQYIVIGTNPSGTLWLEYERGKEIFHPLSWSHNSTTLTITYRLVILLAVITSFIGLYIALIDVTSDALKIAPEKRRGIKRFFITAILLVLPFCSYFLFHRIFSETLIQKFLGPIVIIFITSILPIWWVINSRYVHKNTTPRFIPGGAWMIGLLIICLVVICYLEGVQLAGTMN